MLWSPRSPSPPAALRTRLLGHRLSVRPHPSSPAAPPGRCELGSNDRPLLLVDKREGRPGDLGRETEELAPSHLLPGPKKRGPTSSAQGAAVLQV